MKSTVVTSDGFLLVDVLFDVSDSVTYGRNLLRLVIGDSDAKFLLELHDELYSVERVSTEVIGEASFVLHFL